MEENLRLVLQMSRIPAREQKVMVEQLLEEFHVAHLRHNIGYQLSGYSLAV